MKQNFLKSLATNPYVNWRWASKLSSLLLILLVMGSMDVLAQTTHVQYRTANATETVKMVDGVAYEDYRKSLTLLSEKVELLDLDNNLATYSINLKEEGLELDQIKELVRNKDAYKFQDIQLSDDEQSVLVTVVDEKVKPSDIAHSLLWKNGIR